jgi:crotonobetainyl-CoA:carnitine CoA-transferase CaiB-like acyl-CoA transferase
VLLRLAADCNVFATSLRADTLRRLRLEVGHLRSVNESIVYVRGTGYGAEGPDAGRGAYDHSAYWARSGTAHRMSATESGQPHPPPPAYGDYAGALAVAAGISSALYRQATQGIGSVVDVSLLATGLWQLQPDVINGQLGEQPEPPAGGADLDRFAVPNPLVNNYATADGRFLMFVMVDSNRHWRNFCEVVGAPELADDPRFADGDDRRDNSRECVEILDRVFATHDFEHWCHVLTNLTGEWAPVLRPDEVADDPQVRANRFVMGAELGDGAELPMVVSPVRFDGEVASPQRAPEVGEHTEATLARHGFDWDEIAGLKESGAII